MTTPKNELLFLALGGSNEIGMNVNLYGCDGKWVMVDLGLTFANSEYPGIDLVLPDLEFIEKRKKDLLGIVLTHGQLEQLQFSSGHPTKALVLPNSIQLISIPFVSQDEYDWALSQCDFNIVRGEDSFVRAQLAGKPFIWHIYPQEDHAHETKLAAFLDLYLEDTNPELRLAIIAAMTWAMRSSSSRLPRTMSSVIPVMATFTVLPALGSVALLPLLLSGLVPPALSTTKLCVTAVLATSAVPAKLVMTARMVY